jgi:hypothetical protein
MATYAELVGSGDYTGNNAGIIRDWANRDVSVLSNSVISRCINFAADDAYKTLRVPPLELTRIYEVEGTASEIAAVGSTVATDIGPSAFQGGGNVLSITAPSDMIEVVFIRNADVGAINSGIVYNEKVDSRTFNDGFGQTKDFYFYTRVGSEFKLHGNFTRGDTIEIHYYRRLPALDAVYSGNYVNWAANFGTIDVSGTPTLYTNSADKTESFFNTRIAASASNWVGAEAGNWLRDENEKILLFGTLKEVFIYLNDEKEIQKYDILFNEQIDSLNGEERQRLARGGSIAMSFTGVGLG